MSYRNFHTLVNGGFIEENKSLDLLLGPFYNLYIAINNNNTNMIYYEFYMNSILISL